MRIVRTVTGDVNSDELGIFYAHEHLLCVGGTTVALDSDFLLNDRTAMISEINSFMHLGGRTLVDMLPPGLGRDPNGLRALSEETGARIVAATGFHVEKYYDSQHWLYQYSSAQIAELFRAEIEDGMDQWGYRGPLVNRTAAKAGVIKVATGYYKWSRNTDCWFEAAALAQKSTGAPIASHTDSGVLGDKQADRLLSLGVPPEAIIIGHMDKNPDPYVHRDLAARGVFLEFDGASRQKYGPDSTVVTLIAAAAKYGYERQILLGMDLIRRSYYPSYGGGPGLGYLLDTFLPRLTAEGFGDLVPLLMIANPARAFSLDATNL